MFLAPMRLEIPTPSASSALSDLTNIYRERVEEFPTDFLVAKELKPVGKFDDWADIPIVDLKISDRTANVKLAGEAARSFGAFHVTGHGLSVDQLRCIQTQGRSLFELPMERKLQMVKGKNSTCYYTPNNTVEKWHSLHWAESYVTIWNEWSDIEQKIEDHVSFVWPEGNSAYRSMIAEIIEGLQKTAESVLQLLAESLGLESNYFTKFCFPKGTFMFRWNYYPSCPRPADTLGAHAHTDPNFLTVLWQDQVGGLQVKKDGTWHSVKPIEGSLVINISDCLHIFSNGIFKAALHRVLVNDASHRLSLACVMYTDHDTELYAPEQLISKSNPRRYEKITSRHYWKLVLAAREASTGVKSLNGFNLFSRIAAK